MSGGKITGRTLWDFIQENRFYQLFFLIFVFSLVAFLLASGYRLVDEFGPFRRVAEPLWAVEVNKTLSVASSTAEVSNAQEAYVELGEDGQLSVEEGGWHFLLLRGRLEFGNPSIQGERSPYFKCGIDILTEGASSTRATVNATFDVSCTASALVELKAHQVLRGFVAQASGRDRTAHLEFIAFRVGE